MSSSERKPTLADVASRAGVSPTTVSRALNGRGYVSRAMQERMRLLDAGSASGLH